MSIQQNIDYHAQSLADTALSAKDPQIIQSILGNLTKSIQNGTVKPYVGIPLVQSINDHLQTVSQQANMMAALRSAPQVPPEQSIGSQTLASAEPSQGIDTAQSNLPTQMAGGGIVAFDDGGEVESYANKGYVAPIDYDPVEEYRRTRQLGQENLLARAYGKPTQSITAAGIKTPYDPALEYYRSERQNVPITAPAYGEFNKGINALENRRAAWLAGSLDPYSQTSPVGSQPNLLGTQQPVIAKGTTEEKPPIVIHDDKKATTDIKAPQVDVTAKKTDFLDELMSSAKTDRDELKKMILGDEGERAKDRTIDLYTQALKAGFKMMSGTSPYAAANVGPAGEEFATGIAGVLSKERDEKTKRVGQLVALGLKGQELDAELAKLGVTKDYYDAHKKLFESQAKYYDRRTSGSGTAGLGSVPGNVVQSELDRIEGYRAKPTSAPFFTSLPLDVQTALAKTDPKSASYQRAMEVFNTKANEYANSRLGIMRAYGAKQYPTAGSNEIS
jgi:hypothetical protein